MIESISRTPTRAPTIVESMPVRLAERRSVGEDFEAMVLGEMTALLLPPNAEAAFGHGLAGDTWRQMMAEAIAAEIAAGGGFGIAGMIDISGTNAKDAVGGVPPSGADQ